MAVYETRVGALEFTHDFADGYPTDETVEKLYDERDFQRACQAYIWAFPHVSMAQWQYAHVEQLGAENGQIIYFESYEDKIGGLTYNVTTPYALAFIDLAAEGPFVVSIPEGEVRGATHDMWQISFTQLTEPGNYLIVGPDQEIPPEAEGAGFKVFQSPSFNLLVVSRLMPDELDERIALLEEIEIYPYGQLNDPTPRGYIRPDGKDWLAAPPRGIEYWQRLADSINREPVAERDRLIMATLKPLGIEKGMRFDPNERQTKILTEAAFVGEAMIKANDFSKRMESAHYVDGVQWEYATVCEPDQRAEFYDQLDERAAWLYEAVTNDISMHGQDHGWGQIYMSTYKDKDGDWLNGGVNYVQHLPPDVPAESFWSVTLYDVKTRCIIRNEQHIAGRSSRLDLMVNDDGSVDLYFGPDAPAGKEQNWIPTVADKAWFPYFRLYSPTQAFLDKSWILPDIEKATT